MSCRKKPHVSRGLNDFTIALAGNANVGKSISGDEEILVNHDGLWETFKIKNIFNSMSDSPITVTGGFQGFKPNDLFALSLNLDVLKVEVGKVAYVLKHEERRELVQIETSSKRSVTATQDHNFIVLRDGKINVVDADHLLIGDQLPSIMNPHKCPLTYPDFNRTLLRKDSMETGCDGLTWDKIVRIETVENKEGYVYDLSVEGNENFMLANGIFIHNSAIFNQLTGLNQTVGNWPGKTVERAEGTLYFKGYRIKILDLPGIYSLSAFSMEEIVARDYIAVERPDVIINVVDASVLERNLYFTLQLLELEVPMIIALNQIDVASKKGLKIDHEKLSNILGVPVIPTIAVTGSGVDQLISTAVQAFEGQVKLNPMKITYSKEVEEAVQKLKGHIEKYLSNITSKYPSRWLAIKLIEKDEDVEKKVKALPEGWRVLSLASALTESLEQTHGRQSPVLMATERYGIINELVKSSIKIIAPPKISFEEKLDEITAHKILGYPILALIFGLTFSTIFGIGGYLIEILGGFFEGIVIPTADRFLYAFLPELYARIVSNGILLGISAGITIVLPYIVPFYIILSLLEDSGYLPRAAFLLDNPMHKLGLHGKAAICLLLGYGCNVPACVGCRIMERERERFLGGFLTVLIPCAARSVVIFGLVGKYLGIPTALLLYAFNIALIFLIGRIGHKALPGEPMGLLMEIPPYKTPSLKAIAKKTWARTKDFIYIAFPIIVGGSVALSALFNFGLMTHIVSVMKPLIVDWLGLPLLTGIPIIFGVLRKELTLILLAEAFGTLSFDKILTPIQMVTFSLVVMIYVPCVATIAALWREFGFKKTFLTSLVDILLALLIGGVAFRILSYLA
ncbi:MAG: ferrous iron transport protein B [Candidatus Bathyarchaeia archaeon]